MNFPLDFSFYLNYYNCFISWGNIFWELKNISGTNGLSPLSFVGENLSISPLQVSKQIPVLYSILVTIPHNYTVS